MYIPFMYVLYVHTYTTLIDTSMPRQLPVELGLGLKYLLLQLNHINENNGKAMGNCEVTKENAMS